MDFLQTQKLNSFILILIFSSSLISSKADEYFINCGSSSTIATNDGRTFAGDNANHGPLGINLLATKKIFSKKTENQPELYQTAMITSSPATYRFKIIENGTYILRLHFYASSSLSNIRFNVSASTHMLLPNFSSNNGSIVIEEFLLTINTGEFNLYFIPTSSSDLAFVNAIELFLTPLKIQIETPAVVSPEISTNLISRVLRPIHRINFGGQIVPSSNDRLWRTWLPDDPYLQSKKTAKNGPIHISRPNYKFGNATDYDAPDYVYNTAKELNAKFSNATWRFNVSKKSSDYFIRVHFCDMISEGLGAIVFNLILSSQFRLKIDPYIAAPYLAAPFYLDFVAKSDEFGFMDIGIGSRNDTRITENAFINGLEIMEILSGEVKEPELCDSGFSKIGIVSVIGLIASGIVLTYLLVSYLWSDLIYKIPNLGKVKSAEVFPHLPLVNLDEEENVKASSERRFDQPV